MVKYESDWKDALYQLPITEATAPYLAGRDKPVLSSIFSVYDWISDNGYSNFATWVEAAARDAGR
jgi:hypothetical protein